MRQVDSGGPHRRAFARGGLYGGYPARARIEQLIEWVAPVADEIGAAPFLAVPAANAAERQLARLAEGATLREIYAEQVAAGERIG